MSERDLLLLHEACCANKWDGVTIFDEWVEAAHCVWLAIGAKPERQRRLLAKAHRAVCGG